MDGGSSLPLALVSPSSSASTRLLNHFRLFLIIAVMRSKEGSIVGCYGY